MKKIISKILSILSSVILFVVIVVVVLAIIENKTGKNILPIKVMYVMTGSMEPEIPEKSYILVLVTKNVGVGDVISFYSTDESIYGMINTHKIIGINSDSTFQTKGIANVAADTTSVSYENIIGKKVANLPVVTFFGKFLKTPYGLIFMIVFILATFGVASGIVKIKTKKQAHDEEVRRLIDEEIKRLENESKK